MSTRSSAGWLILVAALAIPGGMFYVWWSRLNDESKKQMTQKVRKRLPADEALFAGSPAQGKLTNPIAEGSANAAPVAASTAAPAGAAPAVAASTATPAAMTAAHPGAPDAAAAPGPAGSPGAAMPAQAPGAPGAAPAVSTAPVTVGVVITRDPTLSPYDVVRLEQIALEKALAAQEIVDAGKPAKKLIKREPPIESTVDLQGIVSTPDAGNKAIINGEIYSEGDSIGRVKVLRITSQGVVFTAKGKRFTKSVNK